MLKKIALAVLLTLQFAAVCSVATADMPWPKCGPCPGDKTAVQTTLVP